MVETDGAALVEVEAAPEVAGTTLVVGTTHGAVMVKVVGPATVMAVGLQTVSHLVIVMTVAYGQ